MNIRFPYKSPVPALSPSKFYVALEDNGVPKFSPNPKPHATRDAALMEAERLAKAHPGLTFGVYERNLSSVNERRIERHFTAEQLATVAPVGVYRDTRDLSWTSSTRIVVNKLFGHKAFYVDSTLGRFEPLNPDAWRGVKFEKSDEKLGFIKT